LAPLENTLRAVKTTIRITAASLLTATALSACGSTGLSPAHQRLFDEAAAQANRTQSLGDLDRLSKLVHDYCTGIVKYDGANSHVTCRAK
jgi:hypothetical protein